MEAPFDVDESVVPPQYHLERVVVLGPLLCAEQPALLGRQECLDGARLGGRVLGPDSIEQILA